MRWRAFLVVAGIVATLGAAPSARADTFNVTTTADGNGECPANRLPCTIRTAIASAAANGVSTLDSINVPSGQYVITIGELQITSNLVIVGASATNTTIQADVKGFRVFNVGAEHLFGFSHLTITDGVATGTTNGVGGNILVGSGATVLIDHSRVTNGKALRGGGIGINFGSVSITKSLIDNNHAISAAGVPSGDGGGIAALGSATTGADSTLQLTDSTVFHNDASLASGIAVRGSATNQATLTRSTIAANAASSQPGAGIYLDSSGNVTAFGTIVANNTGDGGASNCSVKLASNGGNIDTGSTCGFASSVDKQNTDPQLSTLLFSAGGETPVLTLPATSPAIDLIPTASCGTGTLADQRDVRRPQGLGCDSGAYEFDFAPDTAIDSGPSGTIGVNTASFTFSSPEPGVTFQCRMDAAAFTACTSPQSYASLADGSHTFQVRAVDATGNTDATPASRPFTVDTTPPDTNITNGPSGSVSSTSATFTFTSTEANSTFQCSLDNATFATCPSGYTGLSQGAHNFRVRAIDQAGNTDSTPASRDWTVDTVAPSAPVIGGSNALQKTSTVTLSGTAEAGATVAVLEGATVRGSATATGGNWTVTINSVPDGAHSYIARATDAANNTSGNSNTRTITVDTTAPNAPTITTPPANVTQGSATVNLGGAAEAGSTVEVFEGATSRGTTTATGGTWSVTISNVLDGAHSYVARATDAAGNTSGNSGTRTITVDSAFPDTTVTGGPDGLTNGNSPSFTFTSTKANSTFRCKLDGPGAATGTFAACTSPKAYANLADGNYTFSVVATDPLNHEDPTPDTWIFTVDKTPPPANVTSGPSGPTTDPSPAFAFASTETGSTFACKLDGPGSAAGAFGPCTSPASFSGLQPGDYVFFVRATDPAGNATTTSRAFTVTVVQQATPTPTPSPTVGPAQEPTPQPNQTVVIQPVSGKTLVKLPGSKTFEPVDVTRGIPNGSTVDTRKSKIRLFAIPKAGKPVENALFYQGIFKLKLSGGVTELQLVEELACPKAGKADASAKKPKTRKLWGDGSGSFRTRGQYSAATVRGTQWLVQDTCTSTLTQVKKGVVEVQDFVKKKKILVRAPKKYTARQKKR